MTPLEIHQQKKGIHKYLRRPISQKILAQFVTYEGEFHTCRFHEILDGVYGKRLESGERVGNKEFKSTEQLVGRYLKMMCDIAILKKGSPEHHPFYILSDNYKLHSLSAMLLLKFQSLLDNILQDSMGDVFVEYQNGK